ncbi:MAG: hypothetical protein K8S97_10005 [Anaerolineae bacterium]|nr:hypothetical protein [Anaerolineae bacterium]
MKYQDLDLNAWIDRGRSNGTIKNVLTVIWAYCIDEAEALRWVASIVTGETPEREALTSLQDDWHQNIVLAEIDWYSQRPNAPLA